MDFLQGAIGTYAFAFLSFIIPLYAERKNKELKIKDYLGVPAVIVAVFFLLLWATKSMATAATLFTAAMLLGYLMAKFKVFEDKEESQDDGCRFWKKSEKICHYLTKHCGV